jgi:hypothetical protein
MRGLIWARAYAIMRLYRSKFRQDGRDIAVFCLENSSGFNG